MEKKISLEEIITKFAVSQYESDGDEMVLLEKIDLIESYIEFGKQLLDLAAKNAINEFLEMHDYHGDHDCFKLDEEGCYTTNYTNEDGNDVELSFHFDKQSIIDTIEEVE